jgi:amino acid adenylation domain-containing protein
VSRSFDPVALFRRSAQQWPDRDALRVKGETLSYAQLDKWSDRIASAIAVRGIRHQRIILVADKRPECYAALLGILKAGCSYVPLHPDGPTARWEAMISRCEARYALVWAEHAPPMVEAIPLPTMKGEAAVLPVDEVGEAYVLFTSGSTGGPKGVSVSRSNVATYLGHMLSTYDFNEHDRFTQFFALTFDLSVHDLFVCWGVGACLCVPGEADHLRAAAFVRNEGITTWFSVPSVAALMQRMRSLAPDALPSLRLAFFCGEALPWDVARSFALATPNARIINLYGPTETTIAITAFEVQRTELVAQGIVPIGHVYPEHQVRITDGELVLSGPQVTAGYVNDEAATQKAFVHLPQLPGRWYRTGDRAVMGSTGELEYLGRIDDQVKIQGYRVEPAEVDALLHPLLGGGRAFTVPVQDGGATRLVTFIDTHVDALPLMAHCREHLPSYMVPERILHLDRWPLTAHGKTDRKQLAHLAQHGR